MDRQAVLQAEHEVLVTARETVSGERRGGTGAVAEITGHCEIGIAAQFKIFKVQ